MQAPPSRAFPLARAVSVALRCARLHRIGPRSGDSSADGGRPSLVAEWIERKLDPNIGKLLDLSDFAPSLWAAAVRAQWERVEEVRDETLAQHRPGDERVDDPERSRRLRYDSHFLVIAIRRLLRVQEVYLKLTSDERLREARRTFDGTIPHANAKDFRDFLEHLEEYLLGCGKLQKKSGPVGQRPGFEPVIRPGPPRKVVLRFDRYELDLGDAAAAALELAAVVEQVWRDQVSDGMRDWLGSEPTFE